MLKKHRCLSTARLLDSTYSRTNYFLMIMELTINSWVFAFSDTSLATQDNLAALLNFFQACLDLLRVFLVASLTRNFYDNVEFSSKNWASTRMALENHKVIYGLMVLSKLHQSFHLVCRFNWSWVNNFTWSSSSILFRYLLEHQVHPCHRED